MTKWKEDYEAKLIEILSLHIYKKLFPGLYHKFELNYSADGRFIFQSNYDV